MELYLQFGYGMMEHTRHLLTRWGGGTVVLSPRDLDGDRLPTFGAELRSIPNVGLLVDPQFYLPHADHERLRSHGYWPEDYETGGFWQGAPLTTLLSRLVDLNHAVGSAALILPGVLASEVNEDWFVMQEAVLSKALTMKTDFPLLATVALGADATRSQDQIGLLLDRAEHWQPAGYYLVCEHPGGNYLVDDPNWVANVLDMVAGFCLQGRRVILGYCNHQLLSAAAAHAHAICSGTWMNVRSFPPDKFRAAYDEEIRQRAIWYYCPQVLSEYKLPFLDIAQRQGILESLAPSAEVDGDYCGPLFAGLQPTTVGFNEQSAFRHYLHALRAQALAAGRLTFDETIGAHETSLDSAETLLATLSAAGVRGQMRDFLNIVDVNRAALAVLSTTRGPMLRHSWAAL